MDSSKIEFQEISQETWLDRIKNIESSVMTPWVRVSNNLFHSMQWIGREVITSADRRYFAFVAQNEVICTLGVYFLSPRVIRLRGFHCHPKWRNQGHMTKCLEKTLELYRSRAQKALIFSPLSRSGFYKKCNFQEVKNYPARDLEFFDFESKTYKHSDESIVILERQLSPL